MSRYTDEELLDQIRELTRENGGVPPTSNEFGDHPETASYQRVVRRFGKWNKAIRQAGYEPESARALSKRELLSALQQAASNQELEMSRTRKSGDGGFPAVSTYEKRFGGLNVAAIRGSIDIDTSFRKRAVPLTPPELRQFVNQIPQLDPKEQAIALISLLTGCQEDEHRCVSKIGVDETETDQVITFPSRSKRGARTVSIGPLYSELVREFDPVKPDRVKQSITFSDYPYNGINSRHALRRIARSIEFNIDRQAVGDQTHEPGPNVLHRDLRCTHYLFEYTRGSSQAWLASRFALADNEVKHYHRFLDDPDDPDEDGWSVRIDWRD
jgi:hypothetical protein